MTKQELQNIINQGWDERRRESKLRSAIKSLQTQKWKLQEKAVKSKLIEEPSRREHYRPY